MGRGRDSSPTHMYMKHESDGSIIFKPWNELRYLFGLNYPIIIISNATVDRIGISYHQSQLG